MKGTEKKRGRKRGRGKGQKERKIQIGISWGARFSESPAFISKSPLDLFP